MNKPPQNSAQMPDFLKARKLHLNGIILVMTDMKKLNARANKATKVETLTIDARQSLISLAFNSKERVTDKEAEA